MGFFSKVADFIAKASIPIFKYENNSLHFKLSDGEIFFFELSEHSKKSNHDSYVQKAYTISSEDIFLEYVKLSANAQWRGLASSIFETTFKKKLNIQNLETIENKKIGNYIFTTKKVDESFVLHLIYISSSNEDTMIVDMKGELYKALLSKLDDSYTYNFENEEKGSVNFDISLVKENVIYKYIESNN